MPTMRDMVLLRCSERFVDVVDHRPQIGPDRQRLFEGLERRRALGCRALVEIRMAAARELVELSLQLGSVDAEPARQPEDLEVIHSPPLHAPAQNANGPSAGPVPCGSGPATPRTTCRIHSSTSHWG